MKKTKLFRIISCVLALSLICCLTSCADSKSNKTDETVTEGSTNIVNAPEDSAKTTRTIDPNAEDSKEETVYVISDADGSVKKVIVSDWINNNSGTDKLNDSSDLSDIENVKGDESYTMDPDNTLVWDSAGSDIYYQGTSSDEIPVSMNVTYMLDGQAVSADELVGKSGKVTIRFDYTNNKSETVEIDGKNEEINVPFVMLTGMVLSNDTFSNVEVSNGKLVNDGDKCIIMGVALPGMQENLALDKSDVDIPDYVEITADVTDYEQPTVMTLATNEIFNEIDTGDLNKFDDLKDSVTTLSDSMDKLMDGSSQLYDNLNLLLDKTDELLAGIDKLTGYMQQLNDGTKELSSGAASVQSNLNTLSSGLGQISSNSSTLVAGAKQVFQTMLSTVQTQVSAAGLDVPELTIDNYSQVLSSAESSLSTDNVKAMAEQKAKSAVTETVTSSVRESVLSAVLSAQGISSDMYNSLTADQKAAIDAAVDQQMASADVQTKISALVEQDMASDEVQAQINSAVETAEAGAKSLVAAKEQLDSYNTFYTGLVNYTNGVDNAYAGSAQLAEASGKLSSGASSLSSSAAQLFEGMTTLKTQSGAFKDGISQLTQGAMTLSDGLKTFNEQGIQKIVDLADDTTISRIKATIDVSKDYTSFSGLADDMAGSVRFIYKTDSTVIQN